MTKPELTAPAPLTPAHDLAPFDCGIPSLNHWLKRQALKNEAGDASRTYVVCAGNTVVGYYCLAAGAIVRAGAPKSLQRSRTDMPDPIPVIVLGRLAVDQTHQRQGISRALLRDALLRILHAAQIAGVKAILVHAISADAKTFYESAGFLPSPVAPMTLCLPLSTARQALTEQHNDVN